jgi:hypothetical protein
MRPLVPLLVLAAIAAPRPVSSQPTLESLWPNADGVRWDYSMSITDITGLNWNGPGSMRFDGTVPTAGGIAQVLVATHDTPVLKSNARPANAILAAVWRARPDLRPALAARYGDVSAGMGIWYPILLHDGYFMRTSAALQMWQEEWDHPTWTYATADLTLGAQFTQQLIPEIADDVFLHGTVESIDATVMTPAATFAHAVRMGYWIDYGWSEDVLPDGTPTGRFYRSSTVGHVHFAPDTGPVEMHEEFILYSEIDCGTEACPPEWEDQLGAPFQSIDMALTASTVGVRASTFTQVKQLYR